MTTEEEFRHISFIKSGDTINHHGKLRTVCDCDIKRGFCGITIFGDSYSLGEKPVQLVTFNIARPGNI